MGNVIPEDGPQCCRKPGLSARNLGLAVNPKPHMIRSKLLIRRAQKNSQASMWDNFAGGIELLKKFPSPLVL